VTIRVLWQSPQDDGGASVINYTMTVSPGLDPLTTTTTSAIVTIPYNVMHSVSTVAINCNGSSSVAMETILAIGMARYLSLVINPLRFFVKYMQSVQGWVFLLLTLYQEPVMGSCPIPNC